MSFSNATPYVALDFPTMDQNGVAVVTAVVKATFDILEDGRIVASEEPIPLRANDVPLDPDKPTGSLRVPTDLCVEKRGTDVIVVGEAIARTPVKVMDVAVKVRNLTVPLRVHGERVFYQGISDVSIGPAASFERKQIVYERAYGGMSEDFLVIEERNPAGVGVEKRKRDLIGRPAPQIEHPARPHKSAGDKHAPVGFGPIMTHWLPRRSYAGTFDEVWKETRMPVMPRDFDVRHNNAAHPTLQLDEPLTRGDRVTIVGMTESGLLSFEIPPWPVLIRARFDRSGKLIERPTIDTLIVYPAERRFEVVMRKTFAAGRGQDVLREIQIDLDDV